MLHLLSPSVVLRMNSKLTNDQVIMIRDLFFGAILGLALLKGLYARADVGSTVEVTVPISLEDNYHNSSLVVSFQMTKVGEKLDDWKPKNNVEKAMKDFLGAIKSGDAKKALPFLKDNLNLGTVDQVKKFIENYTQTFDMKYVTVDCVVPVNGRFMLVLDFSNSDQAVVGQDKIACSWFSLCETNGVFSCDTAGNIPVEDFILEDVIKQMRNHPDYFQPLHKFLKYSLPISTDHSPVTLKFSGFPCSLDLANPGDTTTNAVAKFYLESYRLLTNASPALLEQFCLRNTPATRDRWRQTTINWTAQNFRTLADGVNGRKVKFVVDASPIYIVFYEYYGALHHEYIVRTKEGLMLTSLFYDGYVDHVLDSIEFLKVVKRSD